MNSDILLGLVPSLISLASIIITALITNSLVKYRVEQLEKKVDKHNSLIERMYVVETEIKDVKEEIRCIK